MLNRLRVPVNRTELLVPGTVSSMKIFFSSTGSGSVEEGWRSFPAQGWATSSGAKIWVLFYLETAVVGFAALRP